MARLFGLQLVLLVAVILALTATSTAFFGGGVGGGRAEEAMARAEDWRQKSRAASNI